MKRSFLGTILLAMVACGGPSSGAEVFSPDSSVGDPDMRNYSYDLQRECFCVPEAREPVRIRVRDRQVTEVRSRTDGRILPLPGVAGWPSLTDIYREIDEAKAAGVPVVIGHDRAGLPNRVEIGSLAADAGIVYHIGEYRQE